MLTQEQLSQLERYAIPPQAWEAWVPEKLTTSFAHVREGGACFGHHPEVGWFALEKNPGADSLRRLKFVESGEAAAFKILPNIQADFNGLIQLHWGTYYVPPSPPKGPGTPAALEAQKQTMVA